MMLMRLKYPHRDPSDERLDVSCQFFKLGRESGQGFKRRIASVNDHLITLCESLLYVDHRGS